VSAQAESKRFDWEIEGDGVQDDLKTKATFTLKQKNLSDVPLEVTSLNFIPD
jgi:hypothetical protein